MASYATNDVIELTLRSEATGVGNFALNKLKVRVGGPGGLQTQGWANEVAALPEVANLLLAMSSLMMNGSKVLLYSVQKVTPGARGPVFYRPGSPDWPVEGGKGPTAVEDAKSLEPSLNVIIASDEGGRGGVGHIYVPFFDQDYFQQDRVIFNTTTGPLFAAMTAAAVGFGQATDGYTLVVTGRTGPATLDAAVTRARVADIVTNLDTRRNLRGY